MNRIRSFFNRNKEFIMMVVMIILFGYILLRLLNYLVKMQNEEISLQEANNNINTTPTYNRDYEIMSGERKEGTAYEQEKSVIEQYLDYCNEKNFSAAYDLITQECKDIFYPNLDTYIKTIGYNYHIHISCNYCSFKY